jgi:hypothetical protein
MLALVTGYSIAKGAQRHQQIGSQQPALPLLRGTVSSARVQAYAETSCVPCRAALRQQRGDHASKQVAHAARGHAGIAPRTDV